jgi:hypothetical protein
MANGFQTQVYYSPAPATEGDFCDANPRYTVDAGPFGLVAGPAGVRIGYFGWLSYSGIDADSAPIAVNSFGSGPVAGIVHREQQGLITTYLAASGMTIPAGFPVTVFAGGGFWVRNNGSGQALPGMKAYADFATGQATFAATGTPTTVSFTAGIAPGTFSVTGSISGNVLTVTAVGSGTVVAGALISGTGVASGTRIVSQLTGTTGGIGTYAVSVPNQDVASTTISGTFGTLTISAGTSPPIGALITVGASAGTTVTAAGSASNIFIVNNTQTVAGGTSFTAAVNVETKWVAMSAGLSGELVKISDQPLG